VALRSEASLCGRLPTAIVGSNPIAGMDVSCECYVLSGRGICVGLITRPGECGVCVVKYYQVQR